jgi:hypothetical protein
MLCILVTAGDGGGRLCGKALINELFYPKKYTEFRVQNCVVRRYGAESSRRRKTCESIVINFYGALFGLIIGKG